VAIQQETSFFNTLSQDERDKRLLQAVKDGQVRRMKLLIDAHANVTIALWKRTYSLLIDSTATARPISTRPTAEFRDPFHSHVNGEGPLEWLG
jgi:hypothetical protein